MTKKDLLEKGQKLVLKFCRKNGLSEPTFHQVVEGDWYFPSVPAFYRPDDKRTKLLMTGSDSRMAEKGYGPGINFCLPKCNSPCSNLGGYNWSWPGHISDKTPYGVMAHELGHHVDWHTGSVKGVYYSEYGSELKKAAKEASLTSYNAEPWEWFAEMFRLFVTNPDLLMRIRPRTYRWIRQDFKPVITDHWKVVLGDCPGKILKACKSKGAT
jgi:hypothetical protein